MNSNDIIDQTLTDEQIETYEGQARRDDWCGFFVGSDIRLLISDLKRARAAISALKFSPITFTPSTGEITIEPMKGGFAGDGDARSSRETRTPESSPGVTTGANLAETVREETVHITDHMIDEAMKATCLFEETIRRETGDGPACKCGTGECCLEFHDDFDRKSMRAALEAAALAHAEDGWQEIDDNTPRDGRLLWLYWPSVEEDDRQTVGWWREGIHGGYWCDHADTEREDPTHWRPLPAPPKDGRE